MRALTAVRQALSVGTVAQPGHRGSGIASAQDFCELGCRGDDPGGGPEHQPLESDRRRPREATAHEGMRAKAPRYRPGPGIAEVDQPWGLETPRGEPGGQMRRHWRTGADDHVRSDAPDHAAGADRGPQRPASAL